MSKDIRRNQIEKAAKVFELFIDKKISYSCGLIFKMGAEWADKNPNKNNYWTDLEAKIESLQNQSNEQSIKLSLANEKLNKAELLNAFYLEGLEKSNEKLKLAKRAIQEYQRYAYHDCPNNSPTPIEECVLCHCEKGLDTALTQLQSAEATKEK